VTCASLGCKTCDNIGRCLSCDDTASFLFDGVCVLYDDNCSTDEELDYVVLGNNTLPECPSCKEEYFKKDWVCSKNCNSRFPHCNYCTDDGNTCLDCEFGYKIGLYNVCNKINSHSCWIKNGISYWWSN